MSMIFLFTFKFLNCQYELFLLLLLILTVLQRNLSFTTLSNDKHVSIPIGPGYVNNGILTDHMVELVQYTSGQVNKGNLASVDLRP